MREEIYYFDVHGSPTDNSSEAVTVIIRELEDNGSLIRETFGRIEKGASNGLK